MVAKETKRPLVLFSLMLAMFMAAIEGTIVATAIPNIVADLGGFSLYSWVFSSFLLMQAVTTMFYGKLADLFGRKPIFVFGVTVFLIGSFLCGLAPTMGWLIFFRFIQGFGAGAMQPIVTIIVGDMYTLQERAKVQGYLSSVWGISSVSGPLIGGLIVQYVDWSWIFWMNIPLGIFGLIGVIVFFHEKVDKEKPVIDYRGLTLFFIAISALIIVFIQAGTAWDWNSSPVWSLLLIFVVAMLLFIHYEKQHPAPMMPLYLWKNKLMLVANCATFLAGMIILGLSSFLPTYVQAVMGESPVIAGFTLSTMSIGWPIAATVAGHLVLRIGFRKTAILGGIFILLGTSLFLIINAEKDPVFAGISSFLIGVGMGLANTSFIVSIQNSVGWKERGIATSLNMFMRIIGSAVGAALLGGILNATLKKHLLAKNMDTSLSNTEILLDDNMRKAIPVDTLMELQHALAQSMHTVFVVLFVLGIATLIILLFFPALKDLKNDDGTHH